jgi:hypothetical protein
VVVLKKISLRDHLVAPQYGLDRVKLSVQRGPLGSFDRPDGERLVRLWNASRSLSVEEAEERLR